MKKSDGIWHICDFYPGHLDFLKNAKNTVVNYKLIVVIARDLAVKKK